MSMSETRLSRTEVLLQGNRGWKNLNEAARILMENRVTSHERPMPLSRLARHMSMDPAHLSRLLDGKAGFVRVYELSENDKPVSKGVYYLIDPAYMAAKTENAEYHYPKSALHIAERMGAAGIVSRVIIKVDAKPKIGTPDSLMAMLMDAANLKATGTLSVPVLFDPAVRDMLVEGNPSPVAKMPDKDLAETEKEFARLAWKAVNNYYSVKHIRAAREVK